MSNPVERLAKALSDRYEIERELGAGGMATVYLARDLKHDRQVAVKVLRPELAAVLGAERFLQEIKTTANLQHPHILPLFDSGEANGFFYYVMPYIEGESLRQRLGREQRMAIDEVLTITNDVAAALSYAHSKGVIHRDVKPENIMFHHGEPLVGDFGIALAVTSAGGERLTETGWSMGTPAYMSPEQVAGERELDARSDVYGLACVVYEMLVGVPPYDGPTAAAIIRNQASQSVPSILQERSDVAPHIDAAVRHALANDPDDRFASIDVFAAALSSAERIDLMVGGSPTKAPTSTSDKSLVVLPFTNASDDPDDAYFSDGLTEELITDLIRIRDLRVVSSASAFRLKGTNKDLRSIGSELGVRYVLEGRMRKSGRSVRITAQLVDVQDDSPVWADKFSGDLENIFELQERVSHAIADALKVQLAPTLPAPNAEAAEMLLRGRHFLRQQSDDGLHKALECFQRATELDRHYAPAFSALAETYVLLSQTWDALAPKEAAPKAKAAAKRAIELDATLPEAHVAYGQVATYHDWDLAAAEHAFREALRLSPNHVEAHKWYAMLLIWLDTRFAEALEHITRAIELDPLNPWVQVQCVWVHYFSRDFEGAIARAREAVNLAPLFGYGHYALGGSLATVGMVGEGVERLHRAINLDGRSVHYVSWLGFSYVMEGRQSEALDCLAELEVHERDGKSVWAWKLPIFAGLGETDRVMRCLEEAFEERSASLVFHLTHPLVDCVRNDPRFADLLRRMNVEHLAAYRPEPRWEPPRTSKSATPGPPVVPLRADPHSPDSATTIAVLPFLNRSADADSAFFADGVTDDIMAQLSKIPALRVISRRSTERYRESDKGIATIASDLGADVILEGTIRRVSQRVRVVAELIDVRADRNVWSETYDRELTDVFAIQSNIAISIATALEKNLSPAEQEELATQPTKDLEAYDLYLLGLHHWTKRSDEGIRRGIQYLTEALQRDPQFTRAKTAMAEAYLFAGIGYASIPLREAQSKALELARDVLATDDSLAAAHATLALASLIGEWNPHAGLESTKRAIALDQSSATAHQWSAWCHTAMGEHVAALQAWDRALKLDPVSAVLTTESGWPLSFVGLHAEARKRYLRAVELEPEFGLAQFNVGLSYDREGSQSEALEWYERAVTSSGGMPFIKGHLGALLAGMGENERAREILTELHAAVSDGRPAFLLIAQVEEAWGNVDAALDALERAFDTHEPLMPWVANPGFIPFEKLRSTARFKKLLDRLGFPEPDLVAERSRVEGWLAEVKAKGGE